MQLPKNLLIVEDELITQRYLVDLMGHYGVRNVACRDNAQDALEFLEKNPCEMILMDINIKGVVDGIMLTEKILEHYRIPVIFITAHSDEQTLKEALRLAPFGFIAKPFSPKEVEVTLQVAYKRFLSHEAALNPAAQERNDTVPINQKYYFEKESRMLYGNNRPVKLNARQRKFIEILATNINQAISYDTLTYSIWDDKVPADSALRTLVYSIRKSLPDFPIVSYNKIGYCLESNE